MSSSNHNKPGAGKPGQRGQKPVQELKLKTDQPQSQKPVQPLGQKPVQPLNQKQVQLQNQKPEPQQNQKPVQLQNQQPQPQPSQKPVQLQNQQPEPQQNQRPAPQQHDGSNLIAAASLPASTLAVDFQAIATAYSDYTKKSFEDTKAFVEKLSGVRSLDKVIEIQTEFAKQAYETFVTESQKIRELYSGLAKQTFKPFDGFIAKKTEAAR